MKFLTPSEKVKQTRKFLKIKQEDLQDKSVSRGLISMIEIGVRVLTKDVAIKLAQKFKLRANELGIKLEIDENFLLRSPSEDAELYCLKKLKDANINDNIEEIFEVACKFNLLKIKADYYSKKADSYLIKKEYDNAFTNYNDAISIYKDINQNEKIPHLALQIGLCKARSSKYDDALTYFYICERYSIMYNDTKTQQLVLYDMALCFKKINKIDLALESIEKYLLSSSKEDDMYIYANILKANCYEAIKNYDVVIDIYSSLLTQLPKPKDPLLGYIYNNLGLVYLDKANFKISLKYFEMAQKIRNTIDSPNLCYTLIEKSELYFRQQLYTKAIKTIESGLKDAEFYKDYECLLKGNYKLESIYISMDDVSTLKKVYLKIVDLLKINNNIIELVFIYSKLSLVYLTENNIEEAKKYLLLIQKIND